MSGLSLYLVITLVGSVVAAIATGGSVGPVAGLAIAWSIQAVAFWRLEAALEDGRSATPAWIGGLLVRFTGLVVLGSIVFAGAADSALAVAYGVSMLVMLLLEAGWLFRRLSWSGPVVSAGVGLENGIEGTQRTG